MASTRTSRTGDHPRGRGEHLLTYAHEPENDGSSPRTRGAQHRPARRARADGIIPADAGSTRSPAPMRRTTWDHPRGRGEHCPRGSCISRRLSGAGDHPRGRGEHLTGCGAAAGCSGSSPRTRGAHSVGERGVPVPGIIPADAGSTRPSLPPLRRNRDHPRGRGEHRSLSRVTRSRMGSSPRTRGALQPDHLGKRARGIIPADAGSTTSTRRISTSSRDHPRGRGEHVPLHRSGLHMRGSSPRTRGARAPRIRGTCAHGIIPADAGSTLAHTAL